MSLSTVVTYKGFLANIQKPEVTFSRIMSLPLVNSDLDTQIDVFPNDFTSGCKMMIMSPLPILQKYLKK